MFNLPIGSFVYLIGIGGVGMTPLALYLHQMGYVVAGSDIQSFRMADALQKAGIQVFTSHQADQVSHAQLVIYSTAIPEGNPEYKEATRLNIPCIDRLEAVSHLVSGKKLLSVTGSYGKSTTTTFSAYFAKLAGLTPSYLIGADLLTFPPAHWNRNQSDWFVFETDESRPEFLQYFPYGCILTNIGTDHLLNYQQDILRLQDHLYQYLLKTNQEGCIVVSQDAFQRLSLFSSRFPCRVLVCGTEASCQYRYEIVNLQFQQDHFETTFHLSVPGKRYQNLVLRMPGEKYVLDAVLAYALITEISGSTIDPDSFRSLPILDRRSQLKRVWKTSLLIDDEGDSPEVIKEVLLNVRNLFPDCTILPIVQPHRFSRLQSLLISYAEVLAAYADEIILMPVYSAGEKPIRGIDSSSLAKQIMLQGFTGVLTLVQTPEEAAEIIVKRRQENMVFILLGPGDVWQVEHALP